MMVSRTLFDLETANEYNAVLFCNLRFWVFPWVAKEKGRAGTLSNLLTVLLPDQISQSGGFTQGECLITQPRHGNPDTILEASPLAQTADVGGEDCVCNLSPLTSCKTLGMLSVFSKLQIFHLLQEDINCASPQNCYEN